MDTAKIKIIKPNALKTGFARLPLESGLKIILIMVNSIRMKPVTFHAYHPEKI